MGGVFDNSVVTQVWDRFTHQNSALLAFLVVALAGMGLAMLLPRRRLAGMAAAVSLAAIAGLTLTPAGGWRNLAFEHGAVASVLTNLEPHRSALTAWFATDDGPANVVLYLPAGLLLTWIVRRPIAVAAGLTALSFAIECWQATLTTRVGSFDDVVSNGLGAAIGAALAAAVLLAVRVAGPRRVPHPA